MSIFSALVLFAVIWFLCLFIVLPMRVRSQEEFGEVSMGTPPSAPANPLLKQKVKWATIAAVLIWIPVVAVIVSGIISVSDFDLFDRWGDGQYG